ncbi:MAG TPA: hypothetical protein VM681_05795 [Candidatus Thermoplasmatota archaeon]|nr:hypothetical protein [Candidatus Thermoplasmatota archaeon]
MATSTLRTTAQPTRCECGQSFPPTLAGAWAAREHMDATRHRMVA